MLEFFFVGEPPPPPPRTWRPERAARAGVRKVRIDGGRVRWRSRIGVPGELSVHEISHVLLINVDYGRNPMWGPPLLALVFDHDGAVRLRVIAGGSPRAAGPEGQRRLRELWGEAGIRTERDHTSLLCRAKDYRRRWPEAFRFIHAYNLVTGGLVLAAWMLAVAILERVTGS